MEKKRIINLVLSVVSSTVIILAAVFSGPLVKVENSEEDEVYTSITEMPSEFEDSEVLAFLKDKFPRIRGMEIKGDKLKDYNYYIKLTDVDQDGEEEAVLTGNFGIPVVVLKSSNEGYKVLYQNDRSWNSSFTRDSFNNLCFNISTVDGTGVGYHEEIILRWDGSALKEVWKGITNDFAYLVNTDKGEWYNNRGSYEITGLDPMRLRYIFTETSGFMENQKEVVEKEKTTVKEYTFDNGTFKFVEK